MRNSLHHHIVIAQSALPPRCNPHPTIRYLVVLYYQASKAFAVVDRAQKRAEIDEMKAKYGVDSEKHDEKKKPE
jgi:hypothetical protein